MIRNKKFKKQLVCMALSSVIAFHTSCYVNAENVITNPFEKGQEETDTARTVLPQPIGVAALLAETKTEDEYKQAAQDAIGACWGYTNLGIADVEDNLNVRKIPAEDGKLLGKMPKNSACEVLEITEDGWAHITSGEIEGYVKADYLLTGPGAKRRVNEFLAEVAVVNTDALKVREEPNTDSEVITLVAMGEELTVLEAGDEWVKVDLDDEPVYVAAEYVTVQKQLDTAITMTEVLYGAGVSDVRVDLCQYALQFVGNRYVWGGTSLTKGADCSGFVLSVFKNYGISLPHSSRAQANMGKKISLGEAKPGDLVFYGNGKRINHVAIYLGGGRVVHASNPRTGIRTSGVNYRTPVKVVRIIND